jgi:DNA polymerase I-like protein with 3'-5' exonuclease and polymerase domains
MYLAKGIVPIPVPRGSKRPVLHKWQNLRPAAGDLDALFRDENGNVGLLLGEPSGGLIDADLDSPEAVAVADAFLPPTGWISGRPSSPRSHRWYKTDAPPARAQQKYEDPRELDGSDRKVLCELRSTGGQTLAPPSVHPSGEAISWYECNTPAHVSARDLHSAVARVASAALLARYWPRKMGTRQDAALGVAGGLLRAGWNERDVEALLRATATAAGDDEIEMRVNAVGRTARKIAVGDKATGWPSAGKALGANGEAVIRAVRDWVGLPEKSAGGQAKDATPRRMPEPYRPFPTSALPEPLVSVVRQGAASLGCDDSFLALPALSVTAALIGTYRGIRLKRDWTEPGVVWTAVVADSGTLKSPAQQMIVGPVFRIQKRQLQEYRVAIAAYNSDLLSYKAAEREAKKGGADPGNPPDEPVLRRVVCSDITVEKLGAILEGNPRGVLVTRDELAGWLGSFGRYKAKGAGSDLPLWLEAFRAGPWLIDRKSAERQTLYIPHAAVSVTGGIQPGILAQYLTPDYLESGLFARVLLAMPPKQPKRWSEDEVHPDVWNSYEELIERLLTLEPDRDASLDPVPFVVRLSPDAKSAWVAFYNEWATEQAAVEGELAAALSKLEAYCARFALLHHTVSKLTKGEDCCDPVEPASIEAGAALTRWFAAETRRIYTVLAESAEERDVRRLIDFIRSRGGRITVKALQRSNSRKYPTAEDSEKALDALVEKGLAQWEERTVSERGGRPTRDCVLMSVDPSDDIDDTDQTDDRPGGGNPNGTGDSPQATDDTQAAPASDGENSAAAGVSSVSSVVGTENSGDDANGRSAAGRAEGHERREGVSSDVDQINDQHGARQPCPNGLTASEHAEFVEREVGEDGYTLIEDTAGLQTVMQALDESDIVGLDTETTGLDPRADRVRLLQLGTDRGVYLVDCFAVDPRPLLALLAEKAVVGHNAVFDLGFLTALGFAPVVVHDTMILSQLLHAAYMKKGFHGLAETARRELGVALDKAAQTSDWSGELTRQQLAYAAHDAAVLVPLYRALDAQVGEAGQASVAAIERRCLPAIAWLSQAGVPFDPAAWNVLAKQAAAEADRLAGRLDAEAPAESGRLLMEGAINWASPAQVTQVFARLGVALNRADDDALAAIDHPLATLLRDYRAANKLATTYGVGWIKNAYRNGRLYVAWKQIGANSGRMACSAPNLQNLPRDPRYRACFRAPEGRVLVKADFSQIELRIAAKVCGDSAMLAAYARREDLHTATARTVLGTAEVTREHRQLAKSLNFGLQFGMGARGFRDYARNNYHVILTLEQAENYRAAFFRTYPGLAAWHRRVGGSGEDAMETRTLTGRRCLNVRRFTEKLNLPVQGAGADGLKMALALLWERRAECPDAFPVLAVHDEIVVEADADRAVAAAAWLKAAMLDAMTPLIDPVPVDDEVKMARTWGGDA